MKKRNNPKIDAMRERSLMVESERQNLNTSKYYINEQKEYKSVEEIKNDVSLGDLLDSGVKIYNLAEEKWGKGNFIIKKDKINNKWIANKIGDETDKIETPMVE